MKYNKLSKDELISKIEKLERDLIKANSINKKLEKAKDIYNQQSSILQFIQSMAIPSADKSTVDEFSEILLKAVKDYTGAVLAVFNYYDSDKKELVLLHIEAEQGILKKALKIAGEKIVNTASPVDDETYKLIIKNQVGTFKTFNEVSFGAIPKVIDKAIRASTGIDRLYPIAHVIEGELYGTTMLAFKNGQTSPSMELLESYAHLISVSLRRYNAEKKTSETKQFYEDIIEGVQDGIWVTNKHDVIYFANTAMERIAGIPREKIQGNNVLKDFPEETIGELIPFYKKAKKEKKPVWYDIKVKTPAGKDTWQNGWLIPQYEKNTFKGIICTIRVITEHKEAELALMESEEKYITLINTANEAIAVAQDGVLKFINKEMSVMLGLPEDVIIGKSFIDFIWPDDRELVLANHQRRIAGEKVPDTYDFRIIGAQKTLKWVLLSANTMQWDGKPATINLLTDITERKTIERELIKAKEKAEESEAKYKDLFVKMMNAFAIHEMIFDEKGEPIDYKFLEVNPAWEKLVGIKAEMVINKTIREIMPDIEECWIQTYGRIVKTGVSREFEDYNKATQKYYHIYAYRTESGKFAVLFNDVTEKKRAEEEIKRTAEMLTLAPNAITVSDYNGNFLYANQKTLDIFGYTWEEFKALPLSKLDTPETVAQAPARIQKIIKNGEARFQVESFKKDGSIIPMEIYVKTTKWDNVDAFITVATDITERKKAEEALLKAKELAEENEEKYRLLHENAGLGIGYLSPEGIVLSFNTIAAADMNGVPEDFAGKSIFDLFPKAAANSYFERLQKAINSDKIEVYEDFVQLPNQEKWFLSTYTKIVDAQNKVLGIQIISQNITDLKQAESELKTAKDKAEESEKQLKLIADNFVNGMIYQVAMLDENRRQFNYISKNVEQLYGCTVQEAKEDANLIYGKLHPDDIEGLVEKEKEALRNMSTFETEARAITPNGNIRWAYYISKPRVINGIVCWDGIEIDITERKQMELELIKAKEKAEENENKFRNAFENAGIGMCLVSLEGKFIQTNKALLNILGYSEDEILNKTFQEITHPDDLALDLDLLKETIKGIREHYSLGKRYFNKAGDIIHTNLNVAIIRNTKKEPMFFVSQIQDISKQKQYEHDLIKAKEKAEESDRLKSAFLANMSHEIRTPMNGILGFTNLLKEPGLAGEDQQKFIDIIEKSGNRMLSTVNDIIDISRIEAGQVDVKIANINLNKQMDELLEFFLPEAKKKNIQLSITNRIPEQQAIFKSDKEKLNSILTNFIKNAIKYTPGGSIKIGYSLKKRDGQNELEFYVKDTGIGIPKKRQKAIFNRFEQADIEDRQVYEGSGLGLAISKAYVEMLGGKIWVESEEGVGSQFYFTLPYETNSKEINKKDSDGFNKNLSVKKDLKILIADDDEFTITFLRIVLEEYAKEMLIAKTGTDAVKMCRDNPGIDAVLMDIKIPGIDGYEATRQIREFNKEVFILAQTAYAQSGDREKCIQAGCDDYISKPINKEKLIDIVINHFNNGE